MTLICFASQKGSPGTTATALAVAAALKARDGRRKLLVEADATGGTLAIRYQLPVEPGLLTLAAAVRSGLEPEGLWQHTQQLPGGLSVVVSPDGSDQVHAALAASGVTLGRFLDDMRNVDVICDVGRLAPDSPALDFVSQASALLMVARPHAEQLQPAARKLVSLQGRVKNLGWVLVGQKPYGAAEVEATYDFPVVGLIADDPRSVASLEQGGISKRLRRHPFVRSSTTLADTLADWLAPITKPKNDASVAAPSVAPNEPQPAGHMTVQPAHDYPGPDYSAPDYPEDDYSGHSGTGVDSGSSAPPPLPPAAEPNLSHPGTPEAPSPVPPVDFQPSAPEPEPVDEFPMSLIELDWLPPAERRQPGPILNEDPYLYSVPFADGEVSVPDYDESNIEGSAVEEDFVLDDQTGDAFDDQPGDDGDEWDASRFTMTADLHAIFERPSSVDRSESDEVTDPAGHDSVLDTTAGSSTAPNAAADDSAVSDQQGPPMPPPDARLGAEQPAREAVLSSSNGSAAPPMPGPDKRLPIDPPAPDGGPGPDRDDPRS